jgi:hypothetical protein
MFSARSLPGKGRALWLTVLLAGGLSCTDAPSAKPAPFGPLAVIEDRATDSQDARAGVGTLAVGSECVTLEGRGGRRLLVWRSGEVEWQVAPPSVVYGRNPDEVTSFHDGERVSVSGTDYGQEPARGEPGPVMPDVEWVAPPNPLCPKEMIVVHSIWSR